MKKFSNLYLSAILFLSLSACSLLPKQNVHTISFNGSAEIMATPDIATFVITVRTEDKDLIVAQQKMAKQSNKALEMLAAKGIVKADIKTENYNTNPQYYYQPAVCNKEICTSGKRVLTGFETSQTVSFKVRDIAKSQEILTELAQLEVGEVNGPNFVIENSEKLKSEAQAQAIAKAKSDAAATAKNLGITLKKIVGFSENSSSFNRSFQYSAMAFRGAPMAAAEKALAPNLEAGEQKIISSVTISYEIE